MVTDQGKDVHEEVADGATGGTTVSTVSTVVQPGPPSEEVMPGRGLVSMEVESSSAGEPRAGCRGGQGAVGRVVGGPAGR